MALAVVVVAVAKAAAVVVAATVVVVVAATAAATVTEICTPAEKPASWPVFFRHNDYPSNATNDITSVIVAASASTNF